VPGAVTATPALRPNWPNPFNPSTALRFDLPEAGAVRLSVYDVGGRLIKDLADGAYPAGSHAVIWDGRDAAGRAVASGSYFARLQAGGRQTTVRMSLVR
jgi:flagellar hook assembly protein FlgD